MLMRFKTFTTGAPVVKVLVDQSSLLNVTISFCRPSERRLRSQMAYRSRIRHSTTLPRSARSAAWLPVQNGSADQEKPEAAHRRAQRT